MTTQVKTTIHKLKTLRYLSGYPLVGNMPDFSKDRLGFLKLIAQKGDVYGMHFGPFPIILFNKPEHVHNILVNKFE